MFELVDISNKPEHVFYAPLDYLTDSLVDYPLSCNFTETSKAMVQNELAIRRSFAE